MAKGFDEAFDLNDWKRKKKAFDEAARKRREKRKRKRLRKERKKNSASLERRQEKEVPGTPTSQNQSIERKSPIFEPEKPQLDSVQFNREKQQVLDGEVSKLGASKGSEDSLMDEPRPTTAEFTLKQSATSASPSSADVTMKSNQSTTTPKAVAVSSDISAASESGKKIVEQSRSEREVPQVSDPPGKATKSGLDRGPLTSVVFTVTGSAMTDDSEISDSRRDSTSTAQLSPTSVTTSKSKDPITTTQSKLFQSEFLRFYLSR